MKTAKKTVQEMKIHVFPFLNRWAIFNETEERPKGVFIDSNEALKSARKILKRNPAQTQVIVHDKNGKIQSILDTA